MIESRRYQRTVIAGAFNVPPQYVGDLERATFNNVEQQSIGFTTDVIYPIAQTFEAAIERDLLTEDDWRSGVVIRFNLDSILRADFIAAGRAADSAAERRAVGERVARDRGQESAGRRQGRRRLPLSGEHDGRGRGAREPAEPEEPTVDEELDKSIARLAKFTGTK